MVQVTHVTDGDTLWVRPLAGGEAFKLRLQGLDAPEICQNWGRESRAALERRLARRTVTVVVSRHDDYGRALARVRLDGEDVGAWMVRQGHAWSYRWRRSPGPYAAEEAQAASARRGLFADATAQRPRDFRQQHGSCKP